MSSVHDELIIELGQLFPACKRIPNAYSLLDNKSIYLESGFGVKVGAVNISDGDYCELNHSRAFTIVFAESVIRLDSDTAPLDKSVNALIERSTLVSRKIKKMELLNGKVIDISLNDISAIEFLSSDKQQILNTEINISVTTRD